MKSYRKGKPSTAATATLREPMCCIGTDRLYFFCRRCSRNMVHSIASFCERALNTKRVSDDEKMDIIDEVKPEGAAWTFTVNSNTFSVASEDGFKITSERCSSLNDCFGFIKYSCRRYSSIFLQPPEIKRK